MKNLLIKLQNKRKEEKGFTLVELLVVIAILAILASVSVVGYMGFTTKAKESNAVTELTQAKTLVTSTLLTDDVEGFEYDAKNNQLYVAEGKKTSDLKTSFADLGSLTGTFAIVCPDTAVANGVYKDLFSVTSVDYTLDGVVATWTFGTNGTIAAK